MLHEMNAKNIAGKCETITEFNAELLRQYSILLEVEDAGETPRAEIETIYAVARKAHITLAGKGGLGKIDERIETILRASDYFEPYSYRVHLCAALMKAVTESSRYSIPWNVYMETAAYAKVWLERLDRKQQEGQE